MHRAVWLSWIALGCLSNQVHGVESVIAPGAKLEKRAGDFSFTPRTPRATCSLRINPTTAF
jgi:hypothetical protein